MKSIKNLSVKSDKKKFDDNISADGMPRIRKFELIEEKKKSRFLGCFCFGPRR